MPAQVDIDPASRQAFVQAAEVWLGDFEAWLTGHPELLSVSPAAAAGWAALIAAGAYVIGSIPERPVDEQLYYAKQGLQTVLAELQRTDLTPVEARRLIERVGYWQDELERLTGRDLPEIPLQGLPSPTTVLTQTGAALADTVARLTTWQQAHHRQVHQRLVQAEGSEAGTAAALGAAAVQLARSTADAFRVVRQVWLPEVRGELLRLVRTETQLRRASDQDIRADLGVRIEVQVQRVGDLVRWLKTEALPSLREDVRAERDARRAADIELRRRLAEEADAREGTDADLLTQLAPLVAWASAFGIHTTEKVKKNEELIDQLGRIDLSQLLALTAFPSLAALVARLLVGSGKAIPGVVGAMEDAAGKALGAVF